MLCYAQKDRTRIEEKWNYRFSALPVLYNRKVSPYPYLPVLLTLFTKYLIYAYFVRKIKYRHNS